MQTLKRLYVLVREDLGMPYAAVQGAHATAQHLIEFPDLWKNQWLIFLKVSDEKKLLEWRDKIIVAGKPYAIFREPDLDNSLTALAVLDDGKMFKKLSLLK